MRTRMENKDPRLNSSGYKDPTAYKALRHISLEEFKIDKRAKDVVGIVKKIVKTMGFEVIGRIQIRDIESRKEYR